MPRFPPTGLDNAIKAAITPGVTYWLGMNATDPGTTGAGEFTAPSRVAVVFIDASGVLSNNAAWTYPNPGTVTANFFSIWTAASAGAFVAGGVGNGVTAANITGTVGSITFAAS